MELSEKQIPESGKTAGTAFFPCNRKMRRRDAVCLLSIAAACFCLYLPSLGFDFLHGWDDDACIAAAWRQWTFWWKHPLEGLFTPLTANSLAWDARFWGGSMPWHFRLTNILLHTANGMLFFLLGRKMRVPSGIMLGAALLWGLHVQRVESVVWIAERKDVLSGFFALLAWNCMNSGHRKAGSFGAACFGVLSVLAKPAMAGVAVLMAVSGFLHRESRRNTAVFTGIPALAAALAVLPAWLMAQGNPPPQGAWTHRAWVAGHNLFWYFANALFPLNACPVYPPVKSWIPAILFAAAGAGLLAAAMLAVYGNAGFPKKWKFYGLWGLVWAAFFFPSSGWRVFSNMDYADRYNYMPCLILCLILALLGRDAAAKERKRLAFLVPAGLLAAAVFGIRAAWYLPVWKNSESLFLAATEYADFPNPRAPEGLGRCGLRQNKPELLETAGRKFLSMSEKTHSGNSVLRDMGLYYCGLAGYLRRDAAEAERFWKELCGREQETMLYLPDVNNPILYGCYGEIRLLREDKPGAVRAMKKQLRYLRTDDPESLLVRGNIAYLEGDISGARRLCRRLESMGITNGFFVRKVEELRKKTESGEKLQE